VVEAVRIDEVDRAVCLLEPIEVPRPHELVLGAWIQIDSVGVAEAELAEHLDLRALARAETEDDHVPRDEPDQVAKAAVEA
jgi:hypothetical protein